MRPCYIALNFLLAGAAVSQPTTDPLTVSDHSGGGGDQCKRTLGWGTGGGDDCPSGYYKRTLDTVDWGHGGGDKCKCPDDSGKGGGWKRDDTAAATDAAANANWWKPEPSCPPSNPSNIHYYVRTSTAKAYDYVEVFFPSFTIIPSTQANQHICAEAFVAAAEANKHLHDD
ncbi:hypothetical protein N0V93_009339 [Gnomoniopsis smithogilvyi]|uniref:Uncharacterized protein n=1 Tax=Gnomoniopsis smithogilvyi TaxID=1191159 RepID=A0A9W9CTK3_9PEZI|nr:hypothetical protein N0V93_009339 [Gnomoniopsis smithogilvyi]